MDSQDRVGQTALMYACLNGSTWSTYFLIAFSKDLNQKDYDGQTALHKAVKYIGWCNQLNSIRWLLLRGADPTIKDHNNKRPIDFHPYYVLKDPLRYKKHFSKALAVGASIH